MANPVFSVSEVTSFVKRLIEEDDRLSFLLVRGEISNFKSHHSGHLYFTLKDDQARIRCVMFRNNTRSLRFKPDNGMKVLLQGRLSVYERQGDYQLYVDGMYEEGLGSLHLAYEKLKQKLSEQGLFEAKHKQSIPWLPRKIGIMSALGSAALHDILTTILRKYPLAQLVIAPILVQGPLAATDMVEKLALLQQIADVDVIIISRGGGSLEDLWAFNDERLVKAIFKATIPVITAVGHEVDTTLVDYVADKRVATPTAAGELVVPELAAILQDLDRQEQQLEYLLSERIRYLNEQIQLFAGKLTQLAPQQRLLKQKLTLDHYEQYMNTLWEQTWQAYEQRLALLNTKLTLLNPQNLLKRGFALVRNLPHKELVQSVKDVRMEQLIEISLQDGQIMANVVQIKAKDDEDE